MENGGVGFLVILDPWTQSLLRFKKVEGSMGEKEVWEIVYNSDPEYRRGVQRRWRPRNPVGYNPVRTI